MKNQAAMDNRANQLNPNNGAYYSSRGVPHGYAPQHFTSPVFAASTRDHRADAPLVCSPKAIAMAREATLRAYARMDRRVEDAARRRRGR